MVAPGVIEVGHDCLADGGGGAVSFGQAFEAGGGVHRVRHHRALEAVLAADDPQHQVADVQTDADADGLEAVLLPFQVIGGHGPVHGDGGLHRVVGPPGEKCHDPVAQVFVDEAPVLRDYRSHPLEIGIEEIEVVLGGHVFGKGRKAAHVGEHHGDFLPGLIPQFDLQDAALPQEIQEFLGDKALVHRVQGRELSGAFFYALLEDSVGALQFLVFLGQHFLEAADGQVGVDPGDDLFRLERLGDVVHRAQLQALDLVLGVGEGGEVDDGDVAQGGVGLQAAADLKAVHVRHHDVQEDQGGPGLLGDGQGAGAVFGHQQLIAPAVQGLMQHLQVGDVVVHQQYLLRLRRRAAGSSEIVRHAWSP